MHISVFYVGQPDDPTEKTLRDIATVERAQFESASATLSPGVREVVFGSHWPEAATFLLQLARAMGPLNLLTVTIRSEPYPRAEF